MGKRTDMRYQRGWPLKRQKNNNKMTCVAGAKGRRGRGEKRDKMIKKTLLKELTVKMIYGRWGRQFSRCQF